MISAIARYHVVAGNIGTVFASDSYRDALYAWGEYRHDSLHNTGRCSHENVVLFDGTEPLHIHEPDYDDNNHEIPAKRVMDACASLRATIRHEYEAALPRLLNELRLACGGTGQVVVDVGRFIQGTRFPLHDDGTSVEVFGGQVRLAYVDGPMTYSAHLFKHRNVDVHALVTHIEMTLRALGNLRALEAEYAD